MSNSNIEQKNYFQPVIIQSENLDNLSPTLLSDILKLKEENLEINIIKPEKIQTISVDQIREAILESYKKNITGKTRVFVFTESDKMNHVAQNAMLKILEEPTEDVLMVLIAKNVEDILSTIQSRCRILRYNINSDKEMNVIDENYLLEKIKATKEEKKESPKLIWRDNNFHPNMIELQCLTNKLSDTIDEQKLSKLWLFKHWLDS